MEVTTIGIDLVKYVFAVCGAESSGRLVMRRQLRRAQVLSFMRGICRALRGGDGGKRRTAALGAPVHRAPARGAAD